MSPDAYKSLMLGILPRMLRLNIPEVVVKVLINLLWTRTSASTLELTKVDNTCERRIIQRFNRKYQINLLCAHELSLLIRCEAHNRDKSTTDKSTTDKSRYCASNNNKAAHLIKLTLFLIPVDRLSSRLRPSNSGYSLLRRRTVFWYIFVANICTAEPVSTTTYRYSPRYSYLTISQTPKRARNHRKLPDNIDKDNMAVLQTLLRSNRVLIFSRTGQCYDKRR